MRHFSLKQVSFECGANVSSARAADRRSAPPGWVNPIENCSKGQWHELRDCCTDDTAERIARLGDPRIRFYNLPVRERYPEDPIVYWRAVGTVAYNLALDQARGEWITRLDDDDIYKPDHVEKLLRFAHEHQYELVYSKMEKQISPTEWKIMGSEPFGVGSVPHSSVMFRAYLKLFKSDDTAWQIGLAKDRHRWLRMVHAGVRAGFLDEITTVSPLRPGTTAPSYWAEDREYYVSKV